MVISGQSSFSIKVFLLLQVLDEENKTIKRRQRGSRALTKMRSHDEEHIAHSMLTSRRPPQFSDLSTSGSQTHMPMEHINHVQEPTGRYSKMFWIGSTTGTATKRGGPLGCTGTSQLHEGNCIVLGLSLARDTVPIEGGLPVLAGMNKTERYFTSSSGKLTERFAPTSCSALVEGFRSSWQTLCSNGL